jgi:hypothetical protein
MGAGGAVAAQREKQPCCSCIWQMSVAVWQSSGVTQNPFVATLPTRASPQVAR